MEIRNFTQVHKICEAAAKKTHYPTVIEEIRRQLPKEWWACAESTVWYFLPRAILNLPTKLDRQEAIASIPDITEPPNMKGFVESGVIAIWHSGKKDVA